MKIFKGEFAEFKSIFFSEDILKENEEHANIVTASTMLNLFWILIITWLLVYFRIFKLDLNVMNIVALCCVTLLLIPSIICYKNKGKGTWIKYTLFISFTILLAIADALLKYNVTLVMALPTILAARYYNKKFTLSIAVFTSILFIVSAFMSVKIGQQDLNTYNLVIPSGTTITINTTLREAITELNIDETQRLINIFIHFFLPKILVFNILAFACAQISQSGKKMIKKQQEITKVGERIETELNIANSIQKNMLPTTFPDHEEIDISGFMTPAKEVGGDFYDVFLIDDNHLAICIADVSGKGVPAALFMMISKTLIKNVTKIDMDVSKAFSRVNNMLCDGNNISIFVTSWFGILDLNTGDIEFVNAGHNAPLLYIKSSGKYEYLKTKPNLVLAGMENTTYFKNKIHIEPGDRLFLYTDGVVESINDENKPYSDERLKDVLNNTLELDSKETIEYVKNDIKSFVGNIEQFDDITMLELIFNKKKENDFIVSKEFDADINELKSVQEFIKSELKKQNCDSKTIKQIDLVVEEVFTNIANYAYKDKKGNCTIKIQYKDKKFKFIFEDNGIPFNPLIKEDPNILLSSKERKIGGLGIYMTKKMMDDVEYKYENNKNVLELTKKI